MKSYQGLRTIDGITVTVDGQPLNERYDLKRFTDSGFEWTYEGNEPAQLALALLADHLGDDRRALDLYERFLGLVVSNLDNDWQLNSDEIDSAILQLEGA